MNWSEDYVNSLKKRFVFANAVMYEAAAELLNIPIKALSFEHEVLSAALNYERIVQHSFGAGSELVDLESAHLVAFILRGSHCTGLQLVVTDNYSYSKAASAYPSILEARQLKMLAEAKTHLELAITVRINDCLTCFIFSSVR